MILLIPLALAAFALLIGWLMWHGSDGYCPLVVSFGGARESLRALDPWFRDSHSTGYRGASHDYISVDEVSEITPAQWDAIVVRWPANGREKQ